MKERPILFTAESVRAILAGTKTQTRRVMKVQPVDKPELLEDKWHGLWTEENRGGQDQRYGVRCPHGVVGDRLWVKETWTRGRASFEPKPEPTWKSGNGATGPFLYRANAYANDKQIKWRSPRFMPRVASRLTLEITGIRVQRVQEIGAIDALYEGIIKEYFLPDPDNFHPPGTYGFVTGLHEFPGGKIHVHPQQAYQELWDTINGKRGFGWEKNPWVWVVEFRRVP